MAIKETTPKTATKWGDDLTIEAEPEIQPTQIIPMQAQESDIGVYGPMIQIAQSIQRIPKTMLSRAIQVGGLLGKSGFYRFPTGGATVEGASINLAQALAQEWGAIAYEVTILKVEPLSSGGKRIHLRARVIDLKAVVLASIDQVISTSSPPGKFANNPEQAERWHTMQSQSAASKVVRNAILRVLPDWYVEAGLQSAMDEDARRATNGKPLAECRSAALELLQELTIQQAEIEAYIGQPVDLWAAPQLGTVKELIKALRHGRESIEAWRANLKPEAPPQPAPAKNALGVNLSEVPSLEAMQAAEKAIPPADVKTIRSALRLPEGDVSTIGPGYWPKYLFELKKAAKELA